MTGQTCGASGGRTKAGAPCRSRLNLGPDGMCVMHSPTRATERAALRVKGGKASGESKRRAKAALPENAPRAPKSLADATAIAAWIVRSVLVGEIDARTGEAATKALRQFQLGEERRALTEKVRALTTKLKAVEKAKGAAAAP